MSTAKLHDEQIDIPDAVVRALVDSQFPQWAGLPLRRLSTDGTIHRIDLLGEDLVLRVPTVSWGESDIAFDADVLPLVAIALPVATPELVARGKPTANVPWEWGVYRRLPGRHPVPGDDADSAALARDLPPLLAALRSLPPLGPPSPAVFAFADDDARTRPKLAELGCWLDPAVASAAWEAALEAEPWDGDGVWIHGDLVSGNLLLEDGLAGARLTGVLDWPASGIGDAAFDLLPAWTGMNPEGRAAFLDAVDATPAQVARGRGYALRKVAWGLPYYEHSLPGFAAMLAHTARQIATDMSPAMRQ
jgi:aminoglycoside phosphotransferase (APT) family kinase protein